MKRNIDRLMIGFVMILAVCLYAPTMLEDYNSNTKTNEKVTEALAEGPAPAMTTETIALAVVTTQEKIEEKVQIKPSLMASDERDKALTIQENYTDFLDSVHEYYAKEEANTVQTVQADTTNDANVTGDGKLTASKGVNYGPTGKETYYNLNMSGVVDIMKSMGYDEQYWVREDGVKMYGDYVMVAADLNTYPRGSLVESSLGTAIVVDTGSFAASNPNQLDIATEW